ncbi:MAG: hypothetical protein ACI8T1_001700 [Verrucomicrobiales bacterium]|jgi:hypothetical protein
MINGVARKENSIGLSDGCHHFLGVGSRHRLVLLIRGEQNDGGLPGDRERLHGESATSKPTPGVIHTLHLIGNLL